MEDIDINQLIDYFKPKLIYVLFAMALAFCLSSIYVNRFRVPEYTNSTTILLVQTSETSQINSSDITLNKSLITTYAEIIKSKRILSQVIDKLNLSMDYSELVSKIGVGEVTDTSIIRISVTDTDSKLAADIANTIADIFTQEIATIYNLENISIIDKAEASTKASSTSTMKIIGISTISGAIICIAIIFILFYFDTTVKNEEEIEKLTNLPVIGVVPISREKIKNSQHRKYYENQAHKHKSQEILPIAKEVKKIEAIDKSKLLANKEKIVNNLNKINEDNKEEK
jgi:capsular polysaccharide biosynthesis protein